MFKNKTLLTTGGTGSFGKAVLNRFINADEFSEIRIFSRDEKKQDDLRKKINDPKVKFIIGDVRDYNSVESAVQGVDFIFHAAALKQVPALEYDPFEAVKTNILGAENIINLAIDNHVKKVLALSSDKAVNPVNLYGATKLCADKLFVAGNSYSGDMKTKFSVVRYGNVFNSRGSVVPFFKEQESKGYITITDERMTRFWITLDEGVNFVLKCLDLMCGGEIFIPKIPSIKIVDLAKAIAPECKHKIVGIRPGEKLHEVLLTADDARHSLEREDMFVTLSAFDISAGLNNYRKNWKKVADRYIYESNTNSKWLSVKDLRKMTQKCI